MPALFRATGIARLLGAMLVSSAVAQAAAAPTVDNSNLDAQLFYQLLIGEIEMRSGEAGTAYEVMLEAARRTKDEQLFRRATEVALQSRAGEQALAAAKAWRTAVPGSPEAHRFLLEFLPLQSPPNYQLVADELKRLCGWVRARSSVEAHVKAHYAHLMPSPARQPRVYRRFRRAHIGELWQHDSSIHQWWPAAAKQTLLLTVDDHSGLNLAGRFVPSTRRLVSLTGTLDPVGGYLMRKPLDWACMKILGQESVVDDQQLLGIGTEKALLVALQGALSGARGLPFTPNNPHDWVGYVDRNAGLVKEWLLS